MKAVKAELLLLRFHKVKMHCANVNKSSVRHGVKVELEPRDPGPENPPQSVKVGPGTPPPLTFKSGTLPPLKSIKVRPHIFLKNIIS